MKKEFRKKVIADRKAKDKDFIEKNSDIITEKLLQMDCIKKAQNIMLYLDFNNEVRTDHLINKLISLRKTVTSPITIVEDRVLIPAQITDLENGIKVGAYNIREPKPDAPTLDVKDLDLVIVPAVAYSEDCYRLGYGGGYYDRFIERLRDDAVTVGIANTTKGYASSFCLYTASTVITCFPSLSCRFIFSTSMPYSSF